MRISALILLLLFQLISCQKSTKNTDSNSSLSNEKISQEINFLNYPIDDLEGITSTQYDGVYRNFDYKYLNGETTFIIVPKVGAKEWYSKQATQYNLSKDIDVAIEKNLNKKSFKNLSNEFDIWVFHISKEYLKHTPNMDSPYTPLIPRKIFLYKYDNSKKNWITISMYSINNENDEVESNKWRESNIAKLSSNNSHFTLDQWNGIYINSDEPKLQSYKEIKNRIGWYEIKISPEEIIFQNDTRIETEFPTEAPGGYAINYKCDYIIAGDTIKLYKKDEDDSMNPKNLSIEKQKPILRLFKRENQYYGICSDIDDSEKLENSARRKSKSPYLFYRFNIDKIN